MAGIPVGIGHTVDAPHVRHQVESQAQFAGPGVRQRDAAQLGEDLDHARLHHTRALVQIQVGGEVVPPAKKHATIRRDTKVIEEVPAVEEHAPARAQLLLESARQRLGRDDVAAHREDAAAQARHDIARVAVRRHEHVARLHLPPGGRHAKAGAGACQTGDLGVFHQVSAATRRSLRQPEDIARRMQRRAVAIDQAAEIRCRADLGAHFIFVDDP